MSEHPDGVRAPRTGPGIDLAAYTRAGGFGGGLLSPFCGAAHPDNPEDPDLVAEVEFVFCRRLRGHEERDDDGHAAFSFAISRPEYWQDAEEHPSVPPF